MRGFAIAGIAFLVAAARPVNAENLQILDLKFQPMIETANGRINVCALHFSLAGVTTSQRAIAVEGTINNSYFADKVPATMVKFSVVAVVQEQLTRLPVKSAALYDSNLLNTAGFAPLPSEDGAAYLAYSLFTQTPDAFASLQDAMVLGSLWLSFNLGEGKQDITALVRSEKDWTKLLEDLHKCNLRGLTQIQEEAGNTP
ncbi:MAG: hypothetical protein SA176_11240 [Edaphobacter sp.]|uniref:hypothetical protein n=1 Tax=Edaphobacter sp. TaxID=1934404 RepID=UPI002981BB70|nr:hypothetical protein [Edaphobacter sp.]MDW5266320.1 hypothetical protein [Edaphobacter sp.]